MAFVHRECLEKWIRARPSDARRLQCEVCSETYTVPVHSTRECIPQHMFSCVSVFYLFEIIILALIGFTLLIFVPSLHLIPADKSAHSSTGKPEEVPLSIIACLLVLICIIISFLVRQLYFGCTRVTYSVIQHPDSAYV